MATSSNGTKEGRTDDTKAVKGGITRKPSSLKVASRGIKSSQDFAQLMSCLMTDLIDGTITPQVSNATCNAGGKLLKIVELQHKYGVKVGASAKKTLELSV